MGELTDQLKDYLENTSQETREQHWFNLMCGLEGIDPTLPNAKKLLKRKQRRYKWRNQIWPTIRNFIYVFLMVWLFVRAGYGIAIGFPIWLCILYILGGLGWLNLLMDKFVEW